MKKPNEKQKKIINIVVTSVQVALVLLAVILSAIILANPNVGNAEVSKGKTKLLPVLTDSMEGNKKDSFNQGDLVVATTPKDVNNLKVGDIITFKVSLGGGVEHLNTHRIVGIEPDGTYVAQGDNNALNENIFDYVEPSEVLAVYKYHLKGVGSAIYWLQQPTNFLLVVVLPLIVLFIYNIVMLVRMIMQSKLTKVSESLVVNEEEIRQKAIADYLAQQENEKKDKEEDKE